jgi:phosphopantetheinyl transferase (holo-ACP synthase)
VTFHAHGLPRHGFEAGVLTKKESNARATTVRAGHGNLWRRVTVTDIDVGRSVTADKTIADKTNASGPADTFYVSIKTDGSGPSATDTEFHLSLSTKTSVASPYMCRLRDARPLVWPPARL